MRNPWLDIPLADYEGHMGSREVDQARLLSDVLACALNEFAPRSLAVLGCAGGNGLERVSGEVTKRVVAVDLNPAYVRETQTRFGIRVRGLETWVGDVQRDTASFAPVELVFAGLLFEYVDVAVVLANVRAMLVPGGRLLTVLQLPSADIPEITPSAFTSLQALSPLMRLVPPEELTRFALGLGYRELLPRTVESAAGKQFRVQCFRLETRGPDRTDRSPG